jgi:hypothetical protein
VEGEGGKQQGEREDEEAVESGAHFGG